MVFNFPHLLPKDDPRYLRWRQSLKKRPTPWNKGKTKNTHLSVMKISQTFKAKKLDNFKAWRDNHFRNQRRIISLPLERTEELAVLTGLVLGDGHICRFPRTEGLYISLNTKYPKLIDFTARLVETVFKKKPKIYKVKNANCARIQLYQQKISERLTIKTGDKRKDKRGVPNWIFREKRFIISCLKGLFEAEASLSIHLPTGTYNFQFSNKNKVLLKQVQESLVALGFHPEVREVNVRLRRKKEVADFKRLIQFREYYI